MVTLSAQEKSRIAQAIAAAEATTSGEIAVSITPQSGDWRAASLAISIAITSLASLTLWLLRPEASFPTLWLLQILCFLLAETFLHLTGFATKLIPASALQSACRRHAESVFHTQNIATTPDRTGILIFLSLNERYAHILPDIGIREKLSEFVWQQILNQLTGAIRAGKLCEGLENAITQCGEKLAEHYPPQPDNTNILPDIVQL